jgi:hypothetical protein
MLVADIARMPFVSAEPGRILEAISTVAVLFALIGVGVGTFVWVRNWRRRITDKSAEEHTIETYREMYDEGLLEREELERIALALDKPSDAPAGPTKPESPSRPLP